MADRMADDDGEQTGIEPGRGRRVRGRLSRSNPLGAIDAEIWVSELTHLTISHRCHTEEEVVAKYDDEQAQSPEHEPNQSIDDSAQHLLPRARHVSQSGGAWKPARPGTLVTHSINGHPAQSPIIDLEIEGEIWTLRGLGDLARFRDSRGMRMLAQLLARPGQELHVLDLSSAPGAGVDRGDAGPELDRKATDAYRTRMRELQQEVAEAESWNDAGRLVRARQEIEFLEAEVKRAIGLGGRERRVGRAAERARINVQRRIAAVLRKVHAVSPALGRHLASSVRTGTFCSYRP